MQHITQTPKQASRVLPNKSQWVEGEYKVGNKSYTIGYRAKDKIPMGATIKIGIGKITYKHADGSKANMRPQGYCRFVCSCGCGKVVNTG